MEIRIVRFKNGQEVIAEIKGYDEKTEEYTLSNPCFVRIGPDPSDPSLLQIMLQPWCPMSVDKDYPAPKDTVMFMASPAPEMLNAYNSSFGAGIVIANTLPLKKSGKPNLTLVK